MKKIKLFTATSALMLGISNIAIAKENGLLMYVPAGHNYLQPEVFQPYLTQYNDVQLVEEAPAVYTKLADIGPNTSKHPSYIYPKTNYCLPNGAELIPYYECVSKTDGSLTSLGFLNGGYFNLTPSISTSALSDLKNDLATYLQKHKELFVDIEMGSNKEYNENYINNFLVGNKGLIQFVNSQSASIGIYLSPANIRSIDSPTLTKLFNQLKKNPNNYLAIPIYNSSSPAAPAITGAELKPAMNAINAASIPYKFIYAIQFNNKNGSVSTSEFDVQKTLTTQYLESNNFKGIIGYGFQNPNGGIPNKSTLEDLKTFLTSI